MLESHARRSTLFFVLLVGILAVHATDPEQFLFWNVTYLNLAPLGITQKVISINQQFPGPDIDTVTNNLLFINVFNSLDEPLLFTWNGVQQRKSSWQDGVLGTTCPIPSGQNYTYEFQVKDQIGSFFYYPSLLLQRAAGGYGGIRVKNRPGISVPFDQPTDDFTVLIGDWYTKNHTRLRASLDNGTLLGYPDGILMNGRGPYGAFFSVNAGNTYRVRISNVGSALTLNFKIAGHQLLLVETEGSYTKQTLYDSLDIHVGQTFSVLITTDQAPGDYYVVANSRFGSPTLTGVGILHYTNSPAPASGPLPQGPANGDIGFSISQAWSIRQNLSTGAARPNPQGAFHYGIINVSKTLLFQNSAPIINGIQRFAVNDISFLNPDTPLKIADYFNIPGVFQLNSIPDFPSGRAPVLGTPVLSGDYRAFLEVIFQNLEDSVQSWHFDGYSMFVVAYGAGAWNSTSRLIYNQFDAIARSTFQVYPSSWTAVMLELDNVGMWNIRSQELQRQYLGQEFYMRVFNPEISSRTESPIPNNVILCGKAVQHQV